MIGSSYFRSRFFCSMLLLLLFVSYQAGIVLFTHVHYVNGESMPEMLPDDRQLGKRKVMPYDVAYKEQDKHGVGHETQIKWPG